MPEGDSIYHAALRIRPILDGQVIQDADARSPARVRGLLGTAVRSVEPLGKHLLIAFDDDTLLRVHLGMKGEWKTAPLERPRPRDFDVVGLFLETALGRAICRYPRVVERFPARERGVHPVLSRLGPDLLRDDVDLDVVVARARRRITQAGPALTAGELLLDQDVAAGIGNVYRAEVLYLEKVHPLTTAGNLDDDGLRRLYARAAALLQANRRPGLRVTTGSPRVPHFVYGRGRFGCGRCGHRVSTTMVGDPARRVYWCERCLRR